MSATAGVTVFVVHFRAPGGKKWVRVGVYTEYRVALLAVAGSGDWRIEERADGTAARPGLFDEEE